MSSSEMGGDAQSDGPKTVISRRPPVSPPRLQQAANPYEMGEALEGEQLGHFQLDEFIGGGGMGAVFRATDTMLGRTVAVKVVSRDRANEDAQRRFKNEAQSAARLDHPNIARVYYVGEDKSWNYIVFEYIEGVNVRDLVAHNGPLSLEDALSYTLQIAEALEHASERDVTHRDIKPSNILIVVDGRAKLVDMGLARLHHVESTADDLTASGVTLGTFDYISPEQARDPRNTDVRSDLYSLGCTLFFMLTGRPPFPDGTVLQKLLSHSSDTPPELRKYRPDLDEEVARIINKLLAKQPDQRFQTPRELIGEVLLMAERLNLSGIGAESAVWLAHNGARPVWWVRHLPWVAAVVSLLLVVLGYTWVESSTSIPAPPPPQLAVSTAGDVQSSTLQPDSTKATADEASSASRQGTSIDAMPPPMEPKSWEEPGVGAPLVEPKPLDSSGDQARAPADNGSRETDAKPSESGNSQNETTEAGRSVNSSQPESEGAEGMSGEGESGKGTLDNGEERGTEKPGEGLEPEEPAETGSGGSEDKRTAEAPAQRIVVTDTSLPYDTTANAVGSLNAALSQAATLDSPAEIELRFDGLRVLQPLSVNTDAIPENQLTIRAAEGFSPILAFHSEVVPAQINPSSMIHVMGGRVNWQGIHFHMAMSETAGTRTNQSLLRLDTTERVEFRDCTFTIRNLDPEGRETGAPIAFMDVVGPGEFGGMMFDKDPLTVEAPAIWMENCVARGQAPFIRADFAVPFSFSWEHGSFFSTQQLIEVGGTIIEPRWEHGQVNVFLSRLLCVADQGICLVRSDQFAPYQLDVSVECNDSLFATKSTQPETPLYQIRTGSAFSPTAIPLEIHGNRNYYKNTQLVLRVETNDDRNAIEQYSFDDLTGVDSPNWFNETNPLPAASFSWNTPVEPVDRQLLRDYVPSNSTDTWFTRALNLDPTQLPRFPEISDTPLRASSSAVQTASPAGNRMARNNTNSNSKEPVDPSSYQKSAKVQPP